MNLYGIETGYALRAVVKTMLMYPHAFEWSVQGFGMLRAYFDKDKVYRLNIWDHDLAVPNVSVIHDHPWSFTSWIINGEFNNLRYEEIDYIGAGCEYDWAVIRTGPGGGPEGDSGRSWLRSKPMEMYRTGDAYHQEPREIHESRFTDGTVTLNERTRLPDGDHARVFWPSGGKWIDAEPRKAMPIEIARVTGKALERWESP